MLPLTPAWIARAVRANARAILARPKLSESTMRQARALATVTEFWVNRNAKAHRLDAVTGEDGDQRLADILTAEPVAPQRYEAPLHQLDQIRALRAYQRFGPIHGAVLTRLPVREILPVHRKRQQERQVRDRFAQFCEQAGIPGQGHDAIAAARLALTLTGTPLNAPMDDVREALRGVQAALRGKTAVSRPSQLGSALLTALIGTPSSVHPRTTKPSPVPCTGPTPPSSSGSTWRPPFSTAGSWIVRVRPTGPSWPPA